jgi:predicted anti-sigma-YlaC factor YlaD
MNCKHIAKRLNDYFSGKLTLAESADCYNHLKECPDCQKSHMQLYQVEDKYGIGSVEPC